MKKTKECLTTVLLNNGEMELSLFDFELRELIPELISSMKKDNNNYIFAVTHNKGNVAMILVDNSNKIYVNEDARDKLMAAWKTAYSSNMKKLIPQIAKELDAGEIIFSGVKIV